jgi:hypothetical protein
MKIIRSNSQKNPLLMRVRRFYISEPTTGIEPVTSSLPRKHSTAELSRQKIKKITNEQTFVIFLWSGRRGSNSRHSAWKADALPTELLPQFLFPKNVGKRFANAINKTSSKKSVGRAGFEPAKFTQLSYSQSSLAA